MVEAEEALFGVVAVEAKEVLLMVKGVEVVVVVAEGEEGEVVEMVVEQVMVVLLKGKMMMGMELVEMLMVVEEME